MSIVICNYKTNSVTKIDIEKEGTYHATIQPSIQSLGSYDSN